MYRATVLAAGLATMLLMGGCPDRWAKNFHPNPAAASSGPAATVVPPQVRKCTPEQLQKATELEEAYLDQHRLSREEETLEDQQKIHELQFAVLRVRDEPGAVMLLGESAFTDEEPVPEVDRDLLEFGRKKGASFILLCQSPPEKTGGVKVEVSRWTLGEKVVPEMSDWRISAWFYRRLSPQERPQK